MSGEETGLKRQIGLFGAVAILVGAVIGSGIFMTPGTVAAAAGSFGPFMVAWILAGAVESYAPWCMQSWHPLCRKPAGLMSISQNPLEKERDLSTAGL